MYGVAVGTPDEGGVAVGAGDDRCLAAGADGRRDEGPGALFVRGEQGAGLGEQALIAAQPRREQRAARVARGGQRRVDRVTQLPVQRGRQPFGGRILRTIVLLRHDRGLLAGTPR